MSNLATYYNALLLPSVSFQRKVLPSGKSHSSQLYVPLAFFMGFRFVDTCLYRTCIFSASSTSGST